MADELTPEQVATLRASHPQDQARTIINSAAQMREAAAKVCDERIASLNDEIEGLPDSAVFGKDVRRAAVIELQQRAERIRAIPLPAEAGGWRPIETAPKDRDIYGYSPTIYGDRWCGIIRWDDDKYHARPRPYWKAAAKHIANAEMRRNQPTMWHELPSPPKGGER